MTSQLANLLVEKGYEVDILAILNISKNYKLYNLNENIKVIKIKNDYKYKFKNKITKRLNKYFGIYKNNIETMKNFMYDSELIEDVILKINNNKYDIVIGVEAYYAMLLGIIKEKITSKVIAWQHNNFNTYFNNKYRYLWNLENLFKEAISKVDENIVLTNYDKIKFDKSFDINSKCISNFTTLNTQKISSGNNNMFITIGRFNYNKGYDLLIKSFKLFNDKNKEWKLTIVCTSNIKKLIRMIRKYNLQNHIQIIKTTDVEKYLLNSDIYLLPSRYEGMPLTYLEAIGCGLPVIGYDIPVMKECTKNNTIIINKFDYIEFANKMLELADDKKTQEKLGENSKKLSRNYTQENILKKWLKILR